MPNTTPASIYSILTGEVKQSRAAEALVGCSTQQFRDWLEKLWLPVMSWDNYGKMWGLNHFLPRRVFKTRAGFFNYRNTYPSWQLRGVEDKPRLSQLAHWQPSDDVCSQSYVKFYNRRRTQRNR